MLLDRPVPLRGLPSTNSCAWMKAYSQWLGTCLKEFGCCAVNGGIESRMTGFLNLLLLSL